MGFFLGNSMGLELMEDLGLESADLDLNGLNNVGLLNNLMLFTYSQIAHTGLGPVVILYNLYSSPVSVHSATIYITGLYN